MGGLCRDRSICPMALWNGWEIKRLMRWIEEKGRYRSIKVNLYDHENRIVVEDW